MEKEKMPVVQQTVVKVNGQEMCIEADYVIEELPLTLFLNEKELVTMLCSPGQEYYLTLGFLASEGIIQTKKDIDSIDIDALAGVVRVTVRQGMEFDERLFLKRYLTACCGKGRASFYFASDAMLVKKAEKINKITAGQSLAYVAMLENASELFRLTGGVHCGALAANGKIVVYSEDIGRHNVFDKLYGRCLEDNIATADKVIIFSGRVSAEIVLKVSKMHVGIIIARSAPTSLALDLAEELGITIIGFARGEKLNIYSHADRVELLDCL